MKNLKVKLMRNSCEMVPIAGKWKKYLTNDQKVCSDQRNMLAFRLTENSSAIPVKVCSSFNIHIELNISFSVPFMLDSALTSWDLKNNKHKLRTAFSNKRTLNWQTMFLKRFIRSELSARLLKWGNGMLSYTKKDYL